MNQGTGHDPAVCTGGQNPYFLCDLIRFGENVPYVMVDGVTWCDLGKHFPKKKYLAVTLHSVLLGVFCESLSKQLYCCDS